jgi:hypothetical protein
MWGTDIVDAWLYIDDILIVYRSICSPNPLRKASENVHSYGEMWFYILGEFGQDWGWSKCLCSNMGNK